MLDKVLVSLKNLKKKTEEEINSASYDYLVKMPIFNLTQEQVENLLIEFNNDIANVLSECWKMSEQPKKEASKHEKKWENIRNICNSYEEEMNRQVPSFPVFFQIPAVPPVHVEVSVSELDYLRNNVEHEVEEGVKAHDPANGVGD